MEDDPALKEAALRGKNMAASSRLDDVYSDEECAFLKAMDAYKRLFHRPNPTVCEVLAVVKFLGYVKCK